MPEVRSFRLLVDLRPFSQIHIYIVHNPHTIATMKATIPIALSAQQDTTGRMVFMRPHLSQISSS